MDRYEDTYRRNLKPAAPDRWEDIKSALVGWAAILASLGWAYLLALVINRIMTI